MVATNQSLLVLIAAVLTVVAAYRPAMKFSLGRILKSKQIVLAAKPDLFSDDLFGDDDEEEVKPKTTAPKSSIEAPKKKYLDEDWTLSPEDSKEFKGFPSSEPVDVPEPAENVPCFALMYKFRREYMEQPIDATLADHRGTCLKYKRLMNTEIINMGKAKGAVLLWAGFTEDDKKETKAEIMSFLEEDPLVTKDVVENWDIIDLSEAGVDALPEAISK